MDEFELLKSVFGNEEETSTGDDAIDMSESEHWELENGLTSKIMLTQKKLGVTREQAIEIIKMEQEESIHAESYSLTKYIDVRKELIEAQSKIQKIIDEIINRSPLNSLPPSPVAVIPKPPTKAELKFRSFVDAINGNLDYPRRKCHIDFEIVYNLGCFNRENGNGSIFDTVEVSHKNHIGALAHVHDLDNFDNDKLKKLVDMFWSRINWASCDEKRFVFCPTLDAYTNLMGSTVSIGNIPVRMIFGYNIMNCCYSISLDTYISGMEGNIAPGMLIDPSFYF